MQNKKLPFIDQAVSNKPSAAQIITSVFEKYL